MDDLLGFYEAELRHLYTGAAEFAQAYPALARQLEITGEGCSEDPQVQRLMQAAALLGARAVRRIEDRFASFTHPLLRMLFPQGLRPFPSCSVAACGPDPKAPPPSEALTLPRGTRLKAPAVRGVRCEFRSAFDVTLWPLRVAAVSYRTGSDPAAGVPLPRGTGALLSLRLALTAKEATWPPPWQPPLRLFLGGDAARAAALREALGARVLGVLVQSDAAGPWRAVGDGLPRPVGFAEAESLLDAGAFVHAAQRLLAEYFAFPRKFDFIDLPWPAALQGVAAREVVLHFALGGCADGSQARLLEGVTAQDLVPGCTPVVNLFHRRVQPVPDAHEPVRCTVAADAQHPWGHEVYAIERLHCAAEQPRPGQPMQEIPPLFSLRNGGPAGDARYWMPVEDSGGDSAGHGTQIAIVTAGMRPAPLDGGALSADITATNAGLPQELDAAAPLDLDGPGAACSARLLQRPTPSLRFELRGDAPLRLISQLSPNPLWLNGRGIEALRDLLRLYDLPRAGAGERLAQGLLAIESQPVTACLRDPEPYIARGTEVRLSVDENRFAGTGLRLFAQVLERWFALQIHLNSFTRLKVVSAGGAELFSGEARPGERPLL